jgi:hypothetical protein
MFRAHQQQPTGRHGTKEHGTTLALSSIAKLSSSKSKDEAAAIIDAFTSWCKSFLGSACGVPLHLVTVAVCHLVLPAVTFHRGGGIVSAPQRHQSEVAVEFSLLCSPILLGVPTAGVPSLYK